ncbi:hypothetical protein AHAS_Ahas11G0244100 [Arachis hypogaea]
MSQDKKNIVEEMGFSVLAHVPEMNVCHKLLRELIGYYDDYYGYLDTLYSRIYITPAKIRDALGINQGRECFPKKVEYSKLSEKNKQIIDSFKGATLASLTKSMLDMSVEGEENGEEEAIEKMPPRKKKQPQRVAKKQTKIRKLVLTNSESKTKSEKESEQLEDRTAEKRKEMLEQIKEKNDGAQKTNVVPDDCHSTNVRNDLSQTCSLEAENQADEESSPRQTEPEPLCSSSLEMER